MNGFCGIVHRNSNRELVQVPLEQSVISVAIVDVSAKVSITQVYRNESDASTPRSKYVFPVPARAAVCAFSMMREEGSLIYGVAKEKSQAMEEYEAGVQEGKFSGLVEWVSDDVFTISLGSIPAKQTVTTRIMFVMDLMNDDLSDKVRLQLPLNLGERYGPTPTGLIDAKTTTEKIRVKITVEVQTSGQIRDIFSPSHDIEPVRYRTHLGRPSPRMIAKFRSRTFLDRDFVLVIRADKLDAPRCFVEEDARGGTIALQLTVIPKFYLPPVPQQEYLFLVDRSGSMYGDRISVAKESLAILIRCLPSQNTSFNIFSFGSGCAQLWGHSVTYNESTLQHAAHHIRGMDADMGPGTELGSGLERLFASRHNSIPAAIFVLTDGEITQEDPVKDVVTAAMASSLPDASFRLFVLGIGLQSSSSVCESLARAGNGESLMAITTERILGKCVSLLRAGRTSTIKDVSIDWGIAPNRDSDTNGPDFIQQAPAEINHLHPHSRFVVFAILRSNKAPKKVFIRGKIDGDQPVELVVKVESIKFGKDDSAPPFIHVLAARRLIRDLEDDRSNRMAPEPVRKATIVRLGEQYQLASSYTSFVAVDYGNVARLGAKARRRQKSDPDDLNLLQLVRTVWTYLSNSLNLLGSNTSLEVESDKDVPGGWPSTSESSSQSLNLLDDLDHESSYWSTDTFSTMSTLESHSSFSSERGERRRRQRTRHRQHRQTRNERSPSPQLRKTPGAAEHSQQVDTSFIPPPRVSRDVDKLVQLMSFDGSFPLNSALTDIIGLSSLDEARALHANENLCATALAIAFLEKNLTDHHELLQGLIDKEMEYVQNHVGRDGFDRVLMRARRLLH